MSDPKQEQGIPVERTPTPSSAVKERLRKALAPIEPRQLPPYKVLLHNDNVNDMGHVVHSILKVTPVSLAEAESKTLEAHNTGVALLLVTHKERAELYQEQFATFKLTVTIEPDA